MDYVMLLGDKIKEKRLELGMKQAELAEGICTQASISNLEHNTTTPSLVLLLAIGKRLNIDLNELSDYAIEQVDPTASIFNQVQLLRSQFKVKEAYNLIIEKLSIEQLKKNHEKKKYYYYLGITSLLGKESISDAHYNFNLALSIESEPSSLFLDILTTNGIGLAYFLDSEKDKALTYFEKSLVELDNFTSESALLNEESIEITKMYYATAKFYSAIEEYTKAVDLCTLGINLQQNMHVNYELEQLYYEKAFNLAKLNRKNEAEEFYSYATALAKMIGNQTVIKVIKKNLSEFKLNLTINLD
ncbi:helix-turn-helix domain-containing protein [Carnobacterium maltaromaticum]|uniref:helix-turn-helix domain-containing protein n=2 Tax=Carnobacterium maltaromaticum TaxID=2751 RepID=UPI0039B0F91F